MEVIIDGIKYVPAAKIEYDDFYDYPLSDVDCDGNSLVVGERAYVRESAMYLHVVDHSTRNGVVEEHDGEEITLRLDNGETVTAPIFDIRKAKSGPVDCDGTPIHVGDKVYVRLSSLKTHSHIGLNESNRYGVLQGAEQEGNILHVHLPNINENIAYFDFDASEIRRNPVQSQVEAAPVTHDADGTPVKLGDVVRVRLSALPAYEQFGVSQNNRVGILKAVLEDYVVIDIPGLMSGLGLAVESDQLRLGSA